MADPIERYIDAARSNADGSHEATFFLADHYAVYDLGRGRVNDGVHAVAGLGFTRPFLPVGPGPGLDAALKGQGRYARKGFHFRGADYARVDLASGIGDSGVNPLSDWALTGTSGTGVDAAFNGPAPKAYFFRGDHYTRWDWTREKPDLGYPRPIAGITGMVAPFSAGVDAAVDGFLFQGADYLRVDWTADGEPRVDGPARVIQDDWPGLVESLLAGKAKAQALVWIADAMRHLAVPFDPLFATALATHFHVAPTASAYEKATTISLVQAELARVVAVLGESSIRFRFRTTAEALTLDHRTEVPPVYYWDAKLNITPRLTDPSPADRATQLLGEAVRAVDPAAGSASVHIPEWYVTDAEAHRLRLPPVRDDPRWPSRYDRAPTAGALHNPSAYAAFARHLSRGRDPRTPPDHA